MVPAMNRETSMLEGAQGDRPRFLVRALAHAPGFVSIRSEAELRIAGPAEAAFGLLDSDRGFVVLTAFHRSASVPENVARFQSVPKRLGAELGKRAPGYWMIAHWRNARGAAAVEDGVEYVWLIPQPEGITATPWLNAAVTIAATFDHEAFVVRSAGEGAARVVGADGHSWISLARGAQTALALDVLAWRRVMIGEMDRERWLDRLRDRTTDEAAMPQVSFHVATAHSIGTHWLFRHIDAMPGPVLSSP